MLDMLIGESAEELVNVVNNENSRYPTVAPQRRIAESISECCEYN